MEKFVELNEQEKLETTGGFITPMIALGTGLTVGAMELYKNFRDINKIKK